MIPAFEQSLHDLGLEYLYLIHWPFPNHHAPGGDVSSRAHDARPYLLANLQAVVAPPLTAREMEALRGLDRGCRLIKGQVFLWRPNQDWRDLWDEDGRIAGW